MSVNELMVAGWKEWVALPELGLDWIKAKLDTGARSSALHARNISLITRGRCSYVRFETHPWQASQADPVYAELPLVDVRQVRSSTGHSQQRYVVATTLSIGTISFSTELTLTSRDKMELRMLIGRQALANRVLVDSARTYVTRDAPASIRDRNRRDGS